MSVQTPNVLLITIDCLRSDHLGCYGYWRDTSRNLDSLSLKGALFTEAISNGGATCDAFPSILRSQPPPIEEAEYRLLPKRNLSLAGLLNEAGYQTAAFHSNPYLTKVYNYDRGFDVFEDSFDTLYWARKVNIGKRRVKGTDGPFKFLPRVRIKMGYLRNLLFHSFGVPSCVTAEKLTDRAISWLDTCDSSFFLWLHYMDTHFPYLPPSEYARKFCNRHISRYRMSALYHKQFSNLNTPERLSPAEINTLINLYDASIDYIDDNLGRLWGSLKRRSDNTIIVVTADHGAAFGEHGLIGHGRLYEELVRVPLIIVGAGIKAGTTVKEAVQLMDLSPTIADLAGISPAGSFHGKRLLPAISGIRSEGKGIISTSATTTKGQRMLAYRTPEWKYISTESSDGSTVLLEELFDLKNDPREKHNLHGSGDKETSAFELEAIDKLQRFKRLKSAEKAAYERERIKAKLRKLPGL